AFSPSRARAMLPSLAPGRSPPHSCRVPRGIGPLSPLLDRARRSPGRRLAEQVAGQNLPGLPGRYRLRQDHRDAIRVIADLPPLDAELATERPDLGPPAPPAVSRRRLRLARYAHVVAQVTAQPARDQHTAAEASVRPAPG